MMPTTTPRCRLVVAWYHENISWVDAVIGRHDEEDAVYSVSVYSKGNGCTKRFEGKHNVTLERLDNRGREAETYLHHICAHYDDLEDLTLFVQGDPAPHMLSINHSRGLLADQIVSIDVNQEGPLLTSYMTEANPPAFHERVDVRKAAEYLLGESGVLPIYSFAAGAQYAVSRESIHKRPLEFWKRAHRAILDDHVNAWEIERLWPLLFTFRPTLLGGETESVQV